MYKISCHQETSELHLNVGKNWGSIHYGILNVLGTIKYMSYAVYPT